MAQIIKYTTFKPAQRSKPHKRGTLLFRSILETGAIATLQLKSLRQQELKVSLPTFWFCRVTARTSNFSNLAGPVRSPTAPF